MSSSVELDEAALLELEAADDVVRVDVLAGVLVHLVVADRAHVAAVEEVELQLLRLGRREEPHGHRDEPEGDGAGPDRAWHQLGVFHRRAG